MVEEMLHERPSPRADLGYRALGVASLLVSCLALLVLTEVQGSEPPPPSTVLPYVLALIACVAASAGSALLIFGARLFERMELPATAAAVDAGVEGRTETRPPEAEDSRRSAHHSPLAASPHGSRVTGNDMAGSSRPTFP